MEADVLPAAEDRERADALESSLAVTIPCYNEAPTIRKVIEDFSAALPGASIVVFDNGSTDDSAEIAREAGATVVRSPLRGKGNVVRHISDVIEADICVLVDGDGTYPADMAPAMIERLRREGLDMLVGTRLVGYEAGAFRPFHHLGNRLISGLIGLLFRVRVTDVLSGYRVVTRDLLRIVRLRTPGFEVETELTLQALAKRMAVAEMPVPYGSRPPGSESKLSTWSDGFLVLRCITLLFKDYKPFVFFTLVALLLAVASLISGSAPIRDFVQSGYVYHVPRAILAAALGTLSIIAFTAGLILDTIARLHQESIELWKQQVREKR